MTTRVWSNIQKPVLFANAKNYFFELIFPRVFTLGMSRRLLLVPTPFISPTIAGN
jgi:hypothetical protein